MTLPATLSWDGRELRLLDQRKLPHEITYVVPESLDDVFHAIRTLTVRGAPAIGVAAAYGLVVAMAPFRALPEREFGERLRKAAAHLATARPTAVNLAWAAKRMVAAGTGGFTALKAMAEQIHEEDRALCRAIGETGQGLITPDCTVLTHCNAGALAVSELGTATAPLYVAHAAGVPFRVFADETRPLWQGARLTAWELSQAGIEVSLICDGAAAGLIGGGEIDLALVGTDRVAANGDVVNKVGTLGVALACHHFGVPFYVACPTPTFDPATANGSDVPIEERDPAEVTLDHAAAVPARNPAFDVTPAALVTGYVTDRGLLTEPAQLRRVLGGAD